jgi:hypothetical protein
MYIQSLQGKSTDDAADGDAQSPDKVWDQITKGVVAALQVLRWGRGFTFAPDTNKPGRSPDAFRINPPVYDTSLRPSVDRLPDVSDAGSQGEPRDR